MVCSSTPPSHKRKRSQMRVLVTGATGFIGRALTAALVADGDEVRAATRRPASYRGPGSAVAFDVADPSAVDAALEGCAVAYYLVHALSDRGDFARHERQAAETFGAAAARHHVRVIYLGGLGDGELRARRSAHLRSRHQVGDVLRARADTVEVQAAVVIGNGSAAFEMVRWMVDWLPVSVLPEWVGTRVQPIGLDDVIRYLVAARDLPAGRYQAGGADVLTYEEMITRYAGLTGRRRHIVKVPVVAPGLTARGIGTATELLLRMPKPPSFLPSLDAPVPLALRLAQGLSVEVVVTDDCIRRLVPFAPMAFDEAVRRAESELVAG